MKSITKLKLYDSGQLCVIYGAFLCVISFIAAVGNWHKEILQYIRKFIAWLAVSDVHGFMLFVGFSIFLLVFGIIICKIGSRWYDSP